MRIPIYEEIRIESHEKEHLLKVFKTKKFRQVPSYVSLGGISNELLSACFNNILEVFITLNINSNFPYPIYLIGPLKKEHPSLKILTSVNQLPQHFFNKTRRLKSKETTLLTKTTLIASKISNENIPDKLNDLSDILASQKELYNLSKEMHFYETILNGLAGR